MRAAQKAVGLEGAGEFRPNRALFEKMEREGTLRAFTVRLTDGATLVGFGLFGLYPHPFYPDVATASCFATYVPREYRGNGFMNWCDAKLHELGVRGISRSVRPGEDYSGALMRRGYRPVETSYMRILPPMPEKADPGWFAATYRDPEPFMYGAPDQPSPVQEC
jgi:hypothetical protein